MFQFTRPMDRHGKQFGPSQPLGGAPSCHRNGRGFTLIELLVVVAIIALLISILLPSLASAKERAKSTACIANLHAIALAYRIYADEFNGVTMQPGGALKFINGVSGWGYWDFFQAATYGDASAGMLSPYLGQIEGATQTGPGTTQLGTLKVAICPSKPPGSLTPFTNPAPYPAGNSYPYFGPGTGYAFRQSTMQMSTLTLTSFSQPEQTLIFVDAENPTATNIQTAPIISIQVQGPLSALGQPATGMTAVFQGRHNGAGNVAWLDGHVSSEKPYINPSMSNYARCAPEKVGYLTPLAPNVSWSTFVNSYAQPSTGNGNYYLWANKDSQQ